MTNKNGKISKSIEHIDFEASFLQYRYFDVQRVVLFKDLLFVEARPTT